MGGENIARQLNVSQYECYPGVDESDEEDLYSQSYDLHPDWDFGRSRRYRSNTAVRLQKMEEERRIQASIRHVHWDKSPIVLTSEEMAELFPRKDISSTTAKSQPHSLLTEMIKNHPTLPANPFREYAKFDGDSQWGPGIRCFRIWLTMLKGEKRNFPMKVSVMATARVLDLIGLVCWRCMAEYSLDETALKESVDYYTLHIAEDDGEVDWDFPCLDNRESVTKFTFNFLALVERDPKKEPPDRHATRHVVSMPSEEQMPRNRERTSESDAEKKLVDIDARIRAPIYESFKVYMLHKVRTKTEVHLGVSGDKVEIDPVVQQRYSAKFFGRHKASTYDMDSVVACDLVDTKSNNKATFRLVYDHSTLSTSLDSSTSSTPMFKNHDFEASMEVANLIVQKINHILELKPSTRRKEYLTHREHKSHRRKSFHLGPR